MPRGNNIYDQGFYLELRQFVQVNQIAEATMAMANGHSMLRASFTRSDKGIWKQSIRPPNGPFHHFAHYSVAYEDPADCIHNGRSIINSTRERLDFENGVVFAVACISVRRSQRLYLTCHHLVVDLVSWRIIFHEMEEYIRLRTLPVTKPFPFFAWVKAHLEDIREKPNADLVASIPPASYWGINCATNRYGDIVRKSFSLDPVTTDCLLQTGGEYQQIEPLGHHDWISSLFLHQELSTR